jgi:hypothetical protein
MTQSSDRDGPADPQPTISLGVPLRAAAAVLKGHRIFAIVFAVSAALRVVVLIAYRPALFFYGDSYGYLVNARQLRPDPIHPILYALLLKPFLMLHRLLPVPALQHLMGLASGLLLYVLLRRLGLGQGWATVGAVPILLDAYQLNVEQYLLAEALFEILIVGALVALLWTKRPSLITCCAGGGLLGLAALARTIGLVLIVPVVGYLLLRRLGLLRPLVLTMAFAAPLLAYAGWFNAVWGPFALTEFQGYWLYGRVAPFADCSAGWVPSYERGLCGPLPPAQRPGSNFYVWRKASPARTVRPPAGTTTNAMLDDFAHRVILHQPLSYAHAVGADLLHFLEPLRSTGPRDYPVRYWQFVPRFTFTSQMNRALARAEGPEAKARVVRPLTVFLRDYQRVMYLNGPLLAVAIVAGLLGGLGLTRAASRGLGAESLLFTASGCLLVIVATMTTMFDYRYLIPSLPLLGPGGAIGASVVRGWFRARAPQPGPPGQVRDGREPTRILQPIEGASTIHQLP